jgi:hypothetical protein
MSVALVFDTIWYGLVHPVERAHIGVERERKKERVRAGNGQKAAPT